MGGGGGKAGRGGASGRARRGAQGRRGAKRRCTHHDAQTAAAPIRRMTSIGFHSVPSRVHTYALRSWAVVMMRFVVGAHTTSVTSASCSLSSPTFSHAPSAVLGVL